MAFNIIRPSDSEQFIRHSLLVVLFAVLASQARAQQVPTTSDDPVAAARNRFGALGVDPRFGVSNLGIDTNVFNTATDPQSDFTFTVVPGAQLFLRTGRGLISIDGGFEFVYFDDFSSERSVNSAVKGQYEFRFNKVRPYVSAGWLDTRQRPDYEIDARARHYEADYHGGADLSVASKSTLRFDFRHLNYRFDGDEIFNGQALHQELNRTHNAVQIGWRQRLTALTTWVAHVSRESERFEFEGLRNSDSFRITSGFELGRFALIRGSALVGYRHLRSAEGGLLPEFSGATADVNVAYTAPTETRLTAQALRDVQYSYERRTPYYVQTGWTATVTQRVTGRWDVQVSGGRDRLSYHAIVNRDARTDFVSRIGGGIGYTLGDQMRFGIDVQSFYRSSKEPSREYGGSRSGISVTYGY